MNWQIINKITPITINMSATLNIYQEKPFAWREIKSTTAPYLNLSNTLPNAPPIIKEIPNLETNSDSFLTIFKRKMMMIIERLINTHFWKLPPPANNPYDIPVLKTSMKSKYSLTYIFSTTPS